jgi:hypothetical protein
LLLVLMLLASHPEAASISAVAVAGARGYLLLLAAVSAALLTHCAAHCVGHPAHQLQGSGLLHCELPKVHTLNLQCEA